MRKALPVLLALLLAPRLFAAENTGVTAASILQIPMGSRALGMGTAFTAVASDISALYYNPAGLSRLNAQEAAFTYISGLADNNIQEIAYGGPLPFAGLSGAGYSSLGGSLLFAQNGTIEVNKTNPDGSFQSSSNLNAGSDFVANMDYSERLASTALDYNDTTYGINHFFGAGGKFIHSTLVQQYSASAVTANAGYLAQSPEAGISFGLSIENLGGGLRYINVTDPLPTTLRSGLAYQGGIAGVHSYTAALDAEYLPQEKAWRANAGLEYFLLKTYGVRIGYQFLQDNVGLTAGIGLRWQSRILFDYAFSMANNLNDSHRITVTYRFGGVTPAERSRQRQPDIENMPSSDYLHEHNDSQKPDVDSLPTPRQNQRDDSHHGDSQGVPGWIY